ncbi:methylated-DNA--[protein]-cysteine S-methyltransferase [Marinomonas sp. 15G1-11]|uniref:Methylated-DNA--protein-cysteine methyltransferase n=1 Tax=Marinomonas phaeophyticola TaxID=3004091 RepID=A0ABT4JSZ8_9GAMM|nr:methylated-DNA--[protein]-cysteine S-methyltransferase [Marinomonas sp. 15G1-11]MCZ2721459.1 methylated-DNA--[protein]-cysteine S-methyltransferase [Marinomonas sp. 15G1-11]
MDISIGIFNMRITDIKTMESYYKALVNREADHVGIFYVGVKTTSVFCIATCRARKPKFENVEFYTEFKDALAAGYRPCKVCKPTENANEAPEQVLKAMEMVRDNPKQRIADWKLRELGIGPELVRRWFNKHYGMTFQAYQRMYRINNAFKELKDGKKTTDAAFDTGYDSLSGFGYTYKKLIGKSPTKSMDNQIILISRFTTPLGPMFVCATDDGVCLLEFVERKMLETEFKDLQKRLNATIVTGENDFIKQAKEQVAEYFDGTRMEFDLPLITPGTEFQNEVWLCLQGIPYGETRSYQQQAENIERPKAVRAVASANGNNRIAIVIPCHRVIGKDGSLTGYAGGLERKRWLLEHEKKHSHA